MSAPHSLVRLAVICAALLFSRASLAQDRWSYELIPFVWTSALNGQQAIHGISTDVDASFTDLLEVLNFGASLRFAAHSDSLGWYAELNYADLEAEDLGPLGNSELRVTQIIGDAGLSYAFNDALAVYGGVRYQDLDNEIFVGNNLSASDNPSWVDGVVGVQWTPVASQNWLLWLRGDVGAGSSDLVWLMETGFGYSWTEAYAVYFAYRLLDTDYSKDGFVYDMQQSGLALGFGFRF